MEDNFYITLPSNVKSFFPQNKISNYKTKLASRLYLPDQWEVGLVEISYTYSWYNLSTRQKLVLLYSDNGEEKFLDEGIYVEPGRYEEIKDLMEVINNKLSLFSMEWKNDTKKPSLEYDSRNLLISLNNGVNKKNVVVLVVFTEELCDILGFKKRVMDTWYNVIVQDYNAEYWEKFNEGIKDYQYGEPKFEQIYGIARYPYELSGGTHSLYVYSDIVKPSFVGDSYSQLLRLIEIPPTAKFGEQILISYPNTYYIPLIMKEFDTIEIDLKDDIGENIQFQFGRTIIVLHFRKVYKKAL